MGEKKYEELRWKNKEKNNATAEIQGELEKKKCAIQCYRKWQDISEHT